MQIDDLTAPPPKLKYSRGWKTIIERNEIDMTMSTQVDAFKYMLNELISDRNFEEISTKEDMLIGCHRVVHGGDFDRPKVITGDTYSQLEAIADLAPLHNLPALEIVQFCVKELPKARNVALTYLYPLCKVTRYVLGGHTNCNPRTVPISPCHTAVRKCSPRSSWSRRKISSEKLRVSSEAMSKQHAKPEFHFPSTRREYLPFSIFSLMPGTGPSGLT